MLPLIIVAGAYMIMLLLLGWSSPIYPTADAPDPIIHAQIVETILSGSGRALLLHSTSPIGLHFTSAALGFLSGLNGLDALRILLAIVLLDSILLTYCCARTLLDPVAAGFTILVAGFVLPADAIHFIKVGTFPNMLSDAIVLAVLWLIFAYMKKPNLGIGLTLAFLAVGGLFVHSTFLAFLAALWLVLPVFFYFDKASVRNYLKALLFTSGGLLSLALLFGSFLAANLQRILFGSYGVSSAPPTPILLTLQTLVWNYGVLAGLLAPFLIVAAVTRVFLRRAASAGIAFTCIWLGTLAIAMVVSTEGWRFILLSLVPGSFLVGDLLSALFRRPIKLLGRGSRSLRSLAPLLLVVLVISGSFIPLLPRVYAPENRNRQGAIVDSMSWLKQNDNNQSVASVGLSADYRYLTTLTGIAYVGDFNESANSTVVQARGARFAYVAVAVQSPQFPTFESSGVVVEKYQNSVAAIFFIPV
jgi:hypothetical protein